MTEFQIPPLSAVKIVGDEREAEKIDFIHLMTPFRIPPPEGLVTTGYTDEQLGLGVHPSPKQRELSDSQRQRVENIRNRLQERHLRPHPFTISAPDDIGFLLSLL